MHFKARVKGFSLTILRSKSCKTCLCITTTLGILFGLSLAISAIPGSDSESVRNTVTLVMFSIFGIILGICVLGFLISVALSIPRWCRELKTKVSENIQKEIEKENVVQCEP